MLRFLNNLSMNLTNPPYEFQEGDGSITKIIYNLSPSWVDVGVYEHIAPIINKYIVNFNLFKDIINNFPPPINLYNDTMAYNYINTINEKLKIDKDINVIITIMNYKYDNELLEQRVYFLMQLLGK